MLGATSQPASLIEPEHAGGPHRAHRHRCSPGRRVAPRLPAVQHAPHKALRTALQHAPQNPSRNALRTARRNATALLLACLPLAAAAYEVTVTPQANAMLEYDENKLLWIEDFPATWQGALTASARIEASDPVTDLTLRPRVTVRRFTDESALDAEDLVLPIEAERRFARSSLGLTAELSRRPQYEADLTEAVLDVGGRDRDEISFTPVWTWFAAPQSQIQLYGGYTQVSFEDSDRTATISGYEFWSAGTTLVHQASERLQISVGGFWTRFDPDGAQNNATTIGGNLGGSYAVSDSLQLEASAGYTVSDLEFQTLSFVFDPATFQIVPLLSDEEETEGGFIFNVGATKRFERGEVEAGFSRRLSPSSQGAQTELETLRGAASYRLRERWTVRADVTFDDRTFQGDTDRARDRSLLTARANLVWRFNEYWRVEAGYRYRLLERDRDDFSSDASAVMLTVRYDYGQPLRIF